MGQVAATRPRVDNRGVRLHKWGRRRMVEEIIGRLPELTGAQLGRPEDELRRERRRRASSAGGERTLPTNKRALRCPSRKSSSTVPTRTAICNWSYAATFVGTARPASADPTGTSSSTREGS